MTRKEAAIRGRCGFSDFMLSSHQLSANPSSEEN